MTERYFFLLWSLKIPGALTQASEGWSVCPENSSWILGQGNLGQALSLLYCSIYIQPQESGHLAIKQQEAEQANNRNNLSVNLQLLTGKWALSDSFLSFRLYLAFLVFFLVQCKNTVKVINHEESLCSPDSLQGFIFQSFHLLYLKASQTAKCQNCLANLAERGAQGTWSRGSGSGIQNSLSWWD